MPWAETELFQVDERVASPGSEDRNLTHLVLGLSMRPPGGAAPDAGHPARPRRRRRASTKRRCPSSSTSSTSASAPTATPPRWSPATRSSTSTDRRVALTETAYQGHRRMTLTYPALAAARQILWLVTGPRRSADPSPSCLAGDASIPAGRVENDQMTVVADEAAAPQVLSRLRRRSPARPSALRGAAGGNPPRRPSAPASLRFRQCPVRRLRPASARCRSSPCGGRTSPCRRRDALAPRSAGSSPRRAPALPPSASPRGSGRRKRRGRLGCLPTRAGTARLVGGLRSRGSRRSLPSGVSASITVLPALGWHEDVEVDVDRRPRLCVIGKGQRAPDRVGDLRRMEGFVDRDYLVWQRWLVAVDSLWIWAGHERVESSRGKRSGFPRRPPEGSASASSSRSTSVLPRSSGVAAIHSATAREASPAGTG